MSRVTIAVPRRKRRKKIFKQAKGFFGAKKSLYRVAKETVKRGLAYNFRDRKVKKRTFRGLWITRISIAAKEAGTSYSAFTMGLQKANIKLNRKILADLAVHDKTVFQKLIGMAKSAA